MSLVTWNDIYHELWMQAGQSRGTVTNVGELPGAPRVTTLPEWPRTTGEDVIAIASLVDPILHATPLRPGGYGITRLWQAAVIEIEGIAFANPAAEYVHNRGFWSTLLAVAAHLSLMGAPVPDDDAWETLTTALWSPTTEYRNGPTARTVTATTFSAMWDALRAQLASARGFDVRNDELGNTLELPRMTNADVLQLEGYWSRPLVRLQVQVMTGAVPSPEGFEDLQLAWQAIIERVDQDAVHGRPTGVFSGNLEFWRVSRELATALELLPHRPAPYVVLHDGAPAFAATPGQPTPPKVAPEKPRPTDLSSRLNDLADNALTAVAHVVNDASDRLVATVGKPLLITGATLAALLLILRATAPCEAALEPALEAEAG